MRKQKTSIAHRLDVGNPSPLSGNLWPLPPELGCGDHQLSVMVTSPSQAALLSDTPFRITSCYLPFPRSTSGLQTPISSHGYLQKSKCLQTRTSFLHYQVQAAPATVSHFYFSPNISQSQVLELPHLQRV